MRGALIAVVIIIVALGLLYLCVRSFNNRQDNPYKGLSRKDREQLKAADLRHAQETRQLALEAERLRLMQETEQYINDPRPGHTPPSSIHDRKDLP